MSWTKKAHRSGFGCRTSGSVNIGGARGPRPSLRITSSGASMVAGTAVGAGSRNPVRRPPPIVPPQLVGDLAPGFVSPVETCTVSSSQPA